MNKIRKKVNQDFFKEWSHNMAYILGFIVADGCVIKRDAGINSYILNITSKDNDILENIREAMGSSHKIGVKYNSLKLPYNQIQVCNRKICEDLSKNLRFLW